MTQQGGFSWTGDTFAFRSGVNLGGWLSQREVPQLKTGLGQQEHYLTFITDDDIASIADWGFDHVRLPFDYDLVEREDNPYTYKEEGFLHIDNCIEWCTKRGLGVLLDFHRPYGISYDRNAINPLLGEAANRERYLALWRVLARRYASVREGLIFELLNEVVDCTGYMYKELIRQAVSAVRGVDAARPVMIGGNMHNSVHTLKELELLDDPAVVYTFHFYEPVPFTHQKAYFCDDLRVYNQTIEYPGDFPGFVEFLNKHPEHADKNRGYVWTENTYEQMKHNLREALLFVEHTGKPLYCGEFGVIDTASADSAGRWLADFTGLLDQYGIPRAYWSYKDMDYGLVDIDGNVRDMELVRIIASKRG